MKIYHYDNSVNNVTECLVKEINKTDIGDSYLYEYSDKLLNAIFLSNTNASLESKWGQAFLQESDALKKVDEAHHIKTLYFLNNSYFNIKGHLGLIKSVKNSSLEPICYHLEQALLLLDKYKKM